MLPIIPLFCCADFGVHYKGSLDLGLPPFRNRNLFAPRYLLGDDRLKALPEWQEPDGLEETFTAIQQLWRDHAVRFNANTNEAQVEEDFIQPILHELGWTYEVQESIAGINTRPDYALFTSADAKTEAQPDKGTINFWSHVDAVGDAKRWGLDLDKGRAGNNPSTQISNYLYRSGVRWGILTNGRKWRLYEQDTARGGDTFYEVDLVDILSAGNLEHFKYFYLFFRREALTPVRDEKTFLQLVFEESERYRTEVGEDLKEAVYDALRTLMNGFLAHSENNMDADDPDTVQQVHDISLIVLYRLLFLLYAEDNDLLPATKQPYKDYSMLTLQKDINQRLRTGEPYAPSTRGLWQSFLNTCELIDDGLPNGEEWVIPAYNGGLFSRKRYPEIAYKTQEGHERWEIGDAYLAEAVDLLAYRREQWNVPGSQDVDYATLDVQHLGSIYEGLLELQPEVAEEPMIEQPSSKGPVVKPQSEVSDPKKVDGAPPRRFDTGEVYLVTDRGERKATGSYYTPEYIVNYIVEHTVGELAEEASEQVEERWNEVAAEYGCDEVEDLDVLIEAAGSGDERRRVEAAKRSLLEPYLSLKVLDPAMGSGHFLVGAADYLSFAMATDPHLPPVPNGEKPQAYYKRLVVQHCLFGVDLNQLAVELAKVSLWMHTVSRDKALSFLDHHLRWGNSLIGARLEEDLRTAPPSVNGSRQSGSDLQTEMTFDAVLERNDLVAFLDAFQRIVEAPAGDAEVERQKDAWYREMDEKREPYRQVANLWLAPYFGVEVSPEHYGQALDALRAGRGSDQWESLIEAEWFQASQIIAKRWRFFHWELEVPEAFFEVQSGRADWQCADARGFDAVIGNPPYLNFTARSNPIVRLRASGKMEAARHLETHQQVCTRMYPDVSSGSRDDYKWFSQRALSLVSNGYFSFIIPNTWLHYETYIDLRRCFEQSGAFARVVDLGDGVFEDSTVPTTVTIIERVSDRPSELQEVLLDIRNVEDKQAMLSGSSSSGSGTPAANIIDRISKNWPQLGKVSGLQVVDAGINYNRKSAGEKALYEGKQEDRRDLPTYRGGSFHRFSPIEPAGWLRHDWEKRLVNGESLNYGERVRSTQEKLALRQTADRPIATLDTTGWVMQRSVLNIMGPSGSHLLAVCSVLNSSLATYLYRELMPEEGRTFAQVKVRQLNKLPWRVMDLGHPSDANAKAAHVRDCMAAVNQGEFAVVAALSRSAFAAHAAHHGPAGKEELRDDEYWANEIRWYEEEVEGSVADLREDFVHDLLAELAQRMIDLKSEQHEVVDRFNTDLRGLCDDDTAEKLQKGKWESTLHKHECCQPFVDGESRSTCSLSDSLGWSEEAFEAFVRELAGKVSNLSDLLAVYRTYADDYSRIADALCATDDLIDRIVYALYGLSEDEIAVIESSLEE